MTIHTIVPTLQDVAELERLRAIDALPALDIPLEGAFDDLVWFAARICDAPFGLICLRDAQRTWFRAGAGLEPDGLLREDAFCEYAIGRPGLFEVRDAREDPQLAGMAPAGGGPQLRFCAGVPLRGPDGRPVGALCVFDDRPRSLTAMQREALERLARRANDNLELRCKHWMPQSRETAVAGLLDALPDAVVTCDAEGNLAEFNAVAREWHGVDARACPPEEWPLHFGLYDEHGAETLPVPQIPLVRAFRGERVRNQTIVLRTPDRPPRTVSCNAEPLRSANGLLLGAVCTMHDITVQARFGKLLERMALTDELTELPNRAAWTAELERVVARAKRSRRPIVILSIDLNDFKQINDCFGHATGDEVLCEFGRRLRRCCRRNDFVARLAGDEFVVCLDRADEGTLDPSKVANQIHRAMARPVRVGDQELAVGCSIGIGVDAGPDFDAARLMQRADQAMYEAKRDRGKGAAPVSLS